METLFDVKKFIHYQLGSDNSEKNLNDNVKTIERLCKKIDVVNAVYEFYTHNLEKKSSNKEIESIDYDSLLIIVKNYAIEFKDYKFINSALKLNDILHQKQIVSKDVFKENKSELLGIVNDISEV